jgi:multiple sugar transport system permease protein
MTIVQQSLSFRTREQIAGYVFILPWLIGFALLIIGPLIASAALSLQDYHLLTGEGQYVGLDNYQRILTADTSFGKVIYNTLYYTVGSVTLLNFVALMMAVLLNQRLRLLWLWRTIFYLPSILTGVSVAVMWRFIFARDKGVLNNVLGLFGVERIAWLTDPAWAKPALIIISVWGFGTAMIIYMAALKSVPRHLYEAAEVDGANAWVRFRFITLPMISPVILFNLIVGVIGTFQVFTTAIVLTSSGTSAVGAPQESLLFYVLYLYQRAFVKLDLGYASALAWIGFGIIFALTFLQLRLSRRWVYYGNDE